MSRIGRVLLNISELRRVPVDPSGVYFLEAVGDDTLVRLRSNRDLRYLRPLGTLFRQFAPYGFLRVHRNTRSTWPASKKFDGGREGRTGSSSSSLRSIAYSRSAVGRLGSC